MSDLVHLSDLANDFIRSSNSEFAQSLPTFYVITAVCHYYVCIAAFSIDMRRSTVYKYRVCCTLSSCHFYIIIIIMTIAI